MQSIDQVMNNRMVYPFLLGCLLLFMKTTVIAQETFIGSSNISVTCNKTTHLIFPYAIRSVDRGSLDVLAQKAPGADNVLQLKAARAGFDETNVTVITADNKLYPFQVTYSLLPEHLTISFAKNLGNTGYQHGIFCTVGIEMHSTGPGIDVLQHTSKQVAGKKKRMYSLCASHAKMNLLLSSLYIQNDVFYFQFRINNFSNIRFDSQNISFTIKDVRKAKRRAVQEQIIHPLLIDGMDSSIQGHSGRIWVVALPKFTLEDGKYLSIQVLEQNGGRNLSIQVVNRHLLGAKTL